MPYFFKRLIETVVPQFFISIIFVFFISNMLSLPSKETNLVFVLMALLLYMYIQGHNLIGYWLAFRDEKIYYTTNLTAYGVLFLLNVIMLFIPGTTSSRMYTYFFLPYKLFVMAGVYKPISAMLVHAILIGLIFIAPSIARRIDGRR